MASTNPTRTSAVAHSDSLPAWAWLWLPLLASLAMAIFAQVDRPLYMGWIEGELGVLELLQFLVMVACFVLALRLLVLPAVRRSRLLLIWVGLAAVGSFYVAGEEASWGQHFFAWATPEQWGQINDQNETNLHNVSSWLDQKPRALLEFGVVIGGIVLPLAALRWPSIRRHRLGILVPPLIGLPCALLAEFFRVLERAYDLVSRVPLLVERPSEVQEMYFFVFMLLYLVVLRRRVLAGGPEATASA